MAWTPYQTALRNALASLLPDREDTRDMLEEAAIPVAQVALGHRPASNWHAAIREAANHGKVEALVAAALQRYPDNPALMLLRKGEAPPESPRVADWHARAAEPDLEKITGLRSTLLPIAFLERGLHAARAVARVRLPGGAGSGFLLRDDVLVTNNHVLPSKAVAALASVDFNYQKTADGADAAVETFTLAPDEIFATSISDDWTIVRVKQSEGRRAGATWGHLELASDAVKVDDPVNIIQHPLGGQKHVALYHNLVAYVDARSVQYFTDTEPGSSGSPVFNDHWSVVAIHRAGGPMVDPTTKASFVRNEGTLASVLLEALQALGLGSP
ncbi:MAG: trypsin-like peptidase domain-containing protein [Polyangiaceae bacterium]